MEEKDLDLLMDSDLFLLNIDGKNLINRIKKISKSSISEGCRLSQ
ncbi:hypothetical protein [Enterococcus dongliensis]|nr:hypothetical protein [Enterococcus dongliensis]